jgi:hypothetical protein
MQIQGIVNPPGNTSAQDQTQPIALMGKAAELIVAELHGKYYTQAYRNNLYNGTTAIGGVVSAVATTTSQTFGIWNPAGNTKNAVLASLDIGLVSGTITIGAFCLSNSLNAGSALATGGISVFTSANPQGGNIGVSGGNSVRFTPSAATTLAGVFMMTLGLSFNTTETTLNYAISFHYDFDGKVIVPPNSAVWVAVNTTVSATSDISLFWEEVPV